MTHNHVEHNYIDAKITVQFQSPGKPTSQQRFKICYDCFWSNDANDLIQLLKNVKYQECEEEDSYVEFIQREDKR